MQDYNCIINQLKRWLTLILITAAIAPSLSIYAGPPAKVTICHIPPGNPGNAHTIRISSKAVAKHLEKHGDSLGPCEDIEDCDDGNPCTIDERDENGICNHDKPVDCMQDGDPCTISECQVDQGGCVAIIQEGENCNDGNACTPNDKCQADGSCQGDAPSSTCCLNDSDCNQEDLCAPQTCNDSNACEAVPVICNASDLCHEAFCDPSNGSCSETPKFCGSDPCLPEECNLVTGDCVFSGQPDCDDDDACTTDSCDSTAGGCVNEPISCQPGTCDVPDSGQCDANTGECSFEKIAGCCEDVADCNFGPEYSDGFSCNGEGACLGNSCSISINQCPFSVDSCTISQCLVDSELADEQGCVVSALPDGTQCQDGVCQDGSCFTGCLSNEACDDGLACTDDFCSGGTCSTGITSCPPDTDGDCYGPESCLEPSGDCVAQVLADGTQCDFAGGSGGGECLAGVCQSEDKCFDVTCPIPNDECITYGCDPNTGICSGENNPNGTPCDADGSPATGLDGKCVEGVCQETCLSNGIDCPQPPIGSACFENICSAEGTCEQSPLPDGTGCAFGGPLNGSPGECLGGECVELDGPCNIAPDISCGGLGGTDCSTLHPDAICSGGLGAVCECPPAPCDITPGEFPCGFLGGTDCSTIHPDAICSGGRGASCECSSGDLCENVTCPQDPNSCNGFTCDPADGICKETFYLPAGTDCNVIVNNPNSPGECNGAGICEAVACNNDSHCATACNTATCDTTNDTCGTSTPDPAQVGQFCDLGPGTACSEGADCICFDDGECNLRSCTGFAACVVDSDCGELGRCLEDIFGSMVCGCGDCLAPDDCTNIFPPECRICDLGDPTTPLDNACKLDSNNPNCDN